MAGDAEAVAVLKGIRLGIFWIAIVLTLLLLLTASAIFGEHLSVYVRGGAISATRPAAD